jgi:hypothetical protein
MPETGLEPAFIAYKAITLPIELFGRLVGCLYLVAHPIHIAALPLRVKKNLKKIYLKCANAPNRIARHHERLHYHTRRYR